MSCSFSCETKTKKCSGVVKLLKKNKKLVSVVRFIIDRVKRKLLFLSNKKLTNQNTFVA